jgi:hypothetical protein
MTGSSRRILPLVAGALTLVLVLTGCDDDDDPTSTGSGTGRVGLLLTDAPFPFSMVDSAQVALDSVTVHVTDGGWTTVDREPRVIDLLDLQGGVMDSVGAGVVAASSVDQIRLYTGEATIYLDDGRSFPLTIPSGSASGVKVFPSPPIDVPEDGEVLILLDFDLSRSFTAIPAAPTRAEDITGFHVHPVLRAENLGAAATVTGTVYSDAGTPGDTADDLPLDGAAVMAYLGVDEVASSGSGPDGRYTLLGLQATTYQVVGTAAGFAADTVEVTGIPGAVVTAEDLRLTPLP